MINEKANLDSLLKQLVTEEGKERLRALAVLGKITKNSEDREKAIKYYSQDNIHSKEYMLYSNEDKRKFLGRIYENVGNFEMALQAYDSNVEEKERLLVKLGKQKEVQDLYKKIFDEHIKENQYEAAIEIAEKKLKDEDLANKMKRKILEKTTTKYAADGFWITFEKARKCARELGDYDAEKDLVRKKVEFIAKERGFLRIDSLFELMDWAKSKGEEIIAEEVRQLFVKIYAEESVPFGVKRKDLLNMRNVCKERGDYEKIIKLYEGCSYYGDAAKIALAGKIKDRAVTNFRKAMAKAEKNAELDAAAKYAERLGDYQKAKAYRSLTHILKDVPITKCQTAEQEILEKAQ